MYVCTSRPCDMEYVFLIRWKSRELTAWRERSLQLYLNRASPMLWTLLPGSPGPAHCHSNAYSVWTYHKSSTLNFKEHAFELLCACLGTRLCECVLRSVCAWACEFFASFSSQRASVLTTPGPSCRGPPAQPSSPGRMAFLAVCLFW